MATPLFDLPVACPVCGLSAVERIFRDFAMTVKGPVNDKNVNGLAAYICKTNGHVFFIRSSDLPRYGAQYRDLAW
jgi:hypothetical protein